MRYITLFSGVVSLAGTPSTALAVLGGFETADGYTGPFSADVWSYDAGQTGGPFLISQYNTGRFQELFGSGSTSDAQYVSQHGIGSGGANMPPYALAVRADTASPDGSYDMTVKYDTGADDLGFAPTTLLSSATIDFDLCPGITQRSNSIDPIFNDVPVFSLSFGGTSTALGATMGFTDHDSSNSNLTKIYYNDGNVFNSQSVAWSGGRFDHIQIDLDYVNQTFDLYWTKDANLTTKAFDAGNTPQLIVAGANMTSTISTIDAMYFQTHTDPSDGSELAHLSKSFLDNFEFAVKAVPEPATAHLVLVGLGMLWATAARRRRQSVS